MDGPARCRTNSTPPVIHPPATPNQTFPPTTYEMGAMPQCRIDSLVYHPDGHLDVRNPDGMQETYSQCNDTSAVSSQCKYATDEAYNVRITVYGDVGVDNLTVHITDDAIAHVRYPFYLVRDASGSYTYLSYSSSTIDANYGITDITPYDCSDPTPPPLPDPMVPGLTYSPTDGMFTFKPLDGPYLIQHGQVFWVVDTQGLGVYNASNATVTPANITSLIPLVDITTTGCTTYENVATGVNGIMGAYSPFQGRWVSLGMLGCGGCVADPYGATYPSCAVCRYGMLYANLSSAPSDENVVPITLQHFPDSRIPCFVPRMPNYTCPVDGGTATSTLVTTTHTYDVNGTINSTTTETTARWLYYNNPTVTPTTPTVGLVPVKCVKNPLTAPKKCSRFTFTMHSAFLEIEIFDGRLIYRVNSRPVSMRCLLPVSTAGSNATGATTTTTIEYNAPPIVLTNKSSVLAQVAGYYGLVLDGGSTRDSTNGPRAPAAILTIAEIIRRQEARIRADARRLGRLYYRAAEEANGNIGSDHDHVHTSATLPPFRKHTLLCCVGDVIRQSGNTTVSFVFEWARTIRSIMTLPADPGLSFEVPTFRDSSNSLRLAVCQTWCAIMRIIPATYGCTGLGDVIGCATGADCGTGLFCSLTDIPMLLMEVIVEILEVIRTIAGGEPAPAATDTPLGKECSAASPATCVASFIIYVTLKIVTTVTSLFRSIGANLDCILCAITQAVTPRNGCNPTLFAIVKEVCDLIDGIADKAVTAIIKLIITAITFLIDLFGGRNPFGQLEIFFKILGEFVVDVGTLIVNFFKNLPGFGAIISFFTMIIDGACRFLQDALNIFADPDLNLRCGGRRKRSLQTHWLPVVSPVVAETWALAGMTRCRDFVAGMNATVEMLVTEADENDVAYCLMAGYWMRDVAPTLTAMSSPCDLTSVAFYRRNLLLSDVPLTEQSPLLRCSALRARMIDVRKTYPVVPPALFDDIYQLPLFAEHLRVGYGAYADYYADRSTPPSVVASASYAHNYMVRSGGVASVAHLVSLAALPTETAVAEALDSDDPALGLARDQYAIRAARAGGLLSYYDPIQIHGAMQLFESLLGSPHSSAHETARKRQAGEPEVAPVPSILERFLNFTVEHIASREVSDVPALNWSDITDTQSRTASHLYHYSLTSVVMDVPVIAAKLYKGSIDAGIYSKATEAGHNIAQVGYAAAIGVMGVVRDIVTGGLSTGAVSSAFYAGVNAPIGRVGSIWHAVERDMTLSDVGQRVTASLSAVWTSSVGRPDGGPSRVLRLMAALANRSVAAKARTAAAASVYSQSRSAAIRGMVAPEHWSAMEVLPVAGEAGFSAAFTFNLSECPVSMSQCLTVYSELCCGCLYVENAVGKLINSFTQAGAYYMGDATADPSLAGSIARFRMMYDYYNTSSGARIAYVGDSPTLPVRWPWAAYDNWRIIGDPTPNKLRFDDLAWIWDEIHSLIGGDLITLAATPDDAVRSAAAQMVRDAMTDALQETVRSAATSGANSGATVARIWSSFLGVDLARKSVSELKNETRRIQVASTSLGQDMLRLGTYFYKWIRSCSYRSELDGSMKRFSAGEALLLIVGVAVSLSVVLAMVTGASFSGFLMVLGAVGTITLVTMPLVLTYTWSYSCLPAMPYQLADDIMHFLYHTLFPACDWFLSGIRKGSGIPYTNDACSSCADYDNVGPSDYYHCHDELGFLDLGYNIAFALLTTVPDIVRSVNATQVPLISSLIQLDYVQQRLNAFGAYNASDPVSFSAHQSCMWVHTPITNFVVELSVLLLISYMGSLIGMLVDIILGTFLLAFYAMMLVVTLFSMFHHVAHMIAPSSDDDDDDDDNDDGDDSEKNRSNDDDDEGDTETNLDANVHEMVVLNVAR